MGNYSNKTIGTEQEFANFSIKIANTTVTSPDTSFDIKSKHLAYIVKNKKPLVYCIIDIWYICYLYYEVTDEIIG